MTLTPQTNTRPGRTGPCGHPDCVDPASSSGQWTYIPDDNTQPIRDGATCTCKKAACHRYFGLKDDPKPPGRKRRVADLAAAVGEGTAPPIIKSIDEIWGIRCALSRC